MLCIISFYLYMRCWSGIIITKITVLMIMIVMAKTHFLSLFCCITPSSHSCYAAEKQNKSNILLLCTMIISSIALMMCVMMMMQVLLDLNNNLHFFVHFSWESSPEKSGHKDSKNKEMMPYSLAVQCNHHILVIIINIRMTIRKTHTIIVWLEYNNQSWMTQQQQE